MTNFSAGAQALGYLYQVRFALSGLLAAPVDTDLYLEGLDDIVFEQNGTALSISICSPRFISVDQSGNLLFVDTSEKRIKRVAFNPVNDGPVTFAPKTEDGSILTRLNDGTWERVYRNGLKIIFNQDGDQKSSVDLVGRTAAYEYDYQRRLKKIIDSANGVLELEYSGPNLSKITDPAGRVTSFSYSGDYLTQVKFYDGTIKRFEYNSRGMMVSEESERGFVTQYSYTDWNRIKDVRLPDGSMMNINTRSALTSAADYTGEMKSTGFDQNEVNSYLIDGNGNKTEVKENVQGNAVAIKDALGNITKMDYNLRGNLTKVVSPTNDTIEYTYDPTTNDLLATKHSTLSITETKAYNQLGQVISETNGMGQSTSRYFNSQGLLLKEVGPSGSEVTYEYGEMGLPISKTVKLNSGKNNTIKFARDKEGRVARTTDNSDRWTEYEYDKAGNIIKMTTTTNDVCSAPRLNQT